MKISDLKLKAACLGSGDDAFLRYCIYHTREHDQALITDLQWERLCRLADMKLDCPQQQLGTVLYPQPGRELAAKLVALARARKKQERVHDETAS